MKVHGRNGWTPQRRSEIAVALINAADVTLQTRQKGHIKIARTLMERARDVLKLNPDLLDANVEKYTPSWMAKENKNGK